MSYRRLVNFAFMYNLLTGLKYRDVRDRKIIILLNYEIQETLIQQKEITEYSLNDFLFTGAKFLLVCEFLLLCIYILHIMFICMFRIWENRVPCV
jgi:hypothetical protein